MRTATHAFNLSKGSSYKNYHGQWVRPMAGSVAACWERPGSATTDTTERKAPRAGRSGTGKPPDPEGDQVRRHLGPTMSTESGCPSQKVAKPLVMGQILVG